MPQQDPFAQYAVKPPPKDDPFAAYAEPAPTGGLAQTYRDLGVGILKGAARGAIGVADMASQSGMVPGLHLAPDVTDRARQSMAGSNPAQDVGGYVEMAAELAPAVAGAAEIAPAAWRAAKKAGPVAMEVAGHIPYVGKPLRMLKVLGRVLDMAGEKAAPVANNAVGRLVPGSSKSLDAELAKALEELRVPEPSPSVELPPPAELPPGYMPRTSAPAPSAPEAPASATPQGRLVPGAPRPTVEQELSAALEDTRKAQPPSRVSTPPPPSLPPGYEPRTSVHGPRNYFLKTDAVTPAAAVPSAGPSMADLPASWQKMTAPATIAPRELDGSGLAAAYQQELIRRGVKPSQAIAMVNRNSALPADVKAIIVKALETVARNQ